jgi:hypothetical protein
VIDFAENDHGVSELPLSHAQMPEAIKPAYVTTPQPLGFYSPRDQSIIHRAEILLANKRRIEICVLGRSTPQSRACYVQKN